jgi:hypothetical protein
MIPKIAMVAAFFLTCNMVFKFISKPLRNAMYMTPICARTSTLSTPFTGLMNVKIASHFPSNGGVNRKPTYI